MERKMRKSRRLLYRLASVGGYWLKYIFDIMLFQKEWSSYIVLSYNHDLFRLKMLYVAFTDLLQNHDSNINYYGHLLSEMRFNPVWMIFKHIVISVPFFENLKEFNLTQSTSGNRDCIREKSGVTQKSHIIAYLGNIW